MRSRRNAWRAPVPLVPILNIQIPSEGPLSVNTPVNAAVAAAVGKGVTHVVPGDHVIVSLTPQCGVCVFCKEGKPYLCAQMSKGLTKGLQPDGSKRLKNSKGEDIGQLLALGTFSERAVVPAGTAIKVKADVLCLASIWASFTVAPLPLRLLIKV